jgi:hypothetical protein
MGSIAAGVQSAIGNVAAGSTFAALQSAGMTGALGTTMAVGAGTAAIGVSKRDNDSYEVHEEDDS